MRVLVVVAHPDDESFGCGSVIAAARARGHTVTVCCATRGEAGEARPGSVPPGSDLGRVRAGELRAAAAELGVDDVRLLDYRDSGGDGPAATDTLCGAPLGRVVADVAAVLADVDPDVVVTLDPTGGDPHRDHVRIATATTEAFDRVARTGARLYHWCLVRSLLQKWWAHRTGADGAAAEVGRPDEDITTVLDQREVLPQRLAAMARHASQQSPYDDIPADLREEFLAADRLVRSRPPWVGGPRETDLFPPEG